MCGLRSSCFVILDEMHDQAVTLIALTTTEIVQCPKRLCFNCQRPGIYLVEHVFLVHKRLEKEQTLLEYLPWNI